MADHPFKIETDVPLTVFDSTPRSPERLAFDELANAPLGASILFPWKGDNATQQCESLRRHAEKALGKGACTMRRADEGVRFWKGRWDGTAWLANKSEMKIADVKTFADSPFACRLVTPDQNVVGFGETIEAAIEDAGAALEERRALADSANG